MIPLYWWLIVAAALFCIGLYGVLSRRNARSAERGDILTDCLGALRFKLGDVVVPGSFIGFFIDQDPAGLHKLTFEFFDIVLHVASLLLQIVSPI